MIISVGLAALVTASAEASQTNAPEAPRTEIVVKVLAAGLEHPWSMQFLPDGRILVTERLGRLRIVSADGQISAPVTGLPPILALGQGGLLDVALAPDFASSGLIFFSFAEARDGGTNGTSVARAKLALKDGGGKLENVSIIFRQQPALASAYHFGSRLVFDRTGALFVTLGERAIARDSAQDLSTDLGKIVRLRPDGSIPEDNPFVGKPQIRPEIWSYGHRNIQGVAIDPKTGQLWTTEHGAKGGDELNAVQAGANYGWPVITWGIDYNGNKIGEGTSKSGMEQPVYYWVPSIATSGLTIYSGQLFRGWTGNILAGGLAGTVLERLVLQNNEVAAVEHLLTDLHQRIRDVRQAPDGSIYVLTDDADGKILRLTPGSEAMTP